MTLFENILVFLGVFVAPAVCICAVLYGIYKS
jgi:hypothetical protein